MTTCLQNSCSFSLPCVCFLNLCQVFACSSFPFGLEGGLWGFDCIDSWSLLTNLVWLNIPPDNCLMRCADLIHLQVCVVFVPTFYSLLLRDSGNSNTFILHYVHFLMRPATMTLHLPKHMRQYSISPAFCVLPTVLPVNWLLCAPYFASILIKKKKTPISLIRGKLFPDKYLRHIHTCWFQLRLLLSVALVVPG